MALVQRVVPWGLAAPTPTSRRAVPAGLTPEDEATNLRVWKMWEEASAFEGELRRFQQDLLEFGAASNEFLESVEPIMLAPLPRVWDSVEGGLAEPIRATLSHGHPHTVGGDASVAALREARLDLDSRLGKEVMRPLDQWRQALGLVEERLPELDAIRRKLGRRNARIQKFHGAGATGLPTSRTLQRRLKKQRRRRGGGGGVGRVFAKMCNPGSGPRVQEVEDDWSSSSGDEEGGGGRFDQYPREQAAVEDEEMRRAYRTRRLEAARQDYVHLEGLVAAQLSGLVRDAAWLKSYMVSSLLLHKEAMQVGVIALGNTKQPLPAFFAERCGLGPGDSHGVMRDNVTLAAELPEGLDLSAVHTGLTPHGGTLLPAELYATKATAQPMELAARPDASALERAPSAPVGAAAVPEAAVEGLETEVVPGSTRTAGTSAAAREVLGANSNMRATDTYGFNVRESPGGVTTPGVGSSGVRGAVQRTAVGQGATRRRYSSSSTSSSSSGDEGLDDILAEAEGANVSSTATAGRRHHMSSSAGTANRHHLSGQRLPAATANTTAADQEEVVCGQKTFTEVENRPVVKERRSRYIEHYPVRKQYITEVRYTGEREVPSASPAELVDSKVRTVAVSQPKSPCETLGCSGCSKCQMEPAGAATMNGGSAAAGGHRAMAPAGEMAVA